MRAAIQAYGVYRLDKNVVNLIKIGTAPKREGRLYAVGVAVSKKQGIGSRMNGIGRWVFSGVSNHVQREIERETGFGDTLAGVSNDNEAASLDWAENVCAPRVAAPLTEVPRRSIKREAGARLSITEAPRWTGPHPAVVDFRHPSLLRRMVNFVGGCAGGIVGAQLCAAAGAALLGIAGPVSLGMAVLIGGVFSVGMALIIGGYIVARGAWLNESRVAERKFHADFETFARSVSPLELAQAIAPAEVPTTAPAEVRAAAPAEEPTPEMVKRAIMARGKKACCYALIENSPVLTEFIRQSFDKDVFIGGRAEMCAAVLGLLNKTERVILARTGSVARKFEKPVSSKHEEKPQAVDPRTGDPKPVKSKPAEPTPEKRKPVKARAGKAVAKWDNQSQLKNAHQKKIDLYEKRARIYIDKLAARRNEGRVARLANCSLYEFQMKKIKKITDILAGIGN